MKHEIRSLTGLRGLAAVLVMFYHYNATKLLTGPIQIFVGHGYLMVDVFLVLSGYVMAMTYGQTFVGRYHWGSYYTFLSRRIARIYPLYVIMILPAGLLIAHGWMDYWPGPPIPVTALINLTMLQSLFGVPTLNTPGWSISAEWAVYLVFPILVTLSLRGSKWRAFFVGLIALILLPIMTALPALIDEPKRAGILDIWHYQTIYPVLRCVIGFVLGMIAYRVNLVPKVGQLLGLNLMAVAIVMIMIVAMCIKSADIFLVYLLPVLMIVIVQEDNWVAKLLSIRPVYWLGQLSFSIYMIHDLMIYFIVALAEWLVGLGMSERAAMSLFTLFFAALVILLSQLTFTYIEKPAREWARRLLAKATS